MGVDYKEYELKPNVRSILSNAKETRLTLTLDNSSFADNVTKDDIILSGSFEDMKIDSFSCSGKNLTMQLIGKPIKPYGLTTYVDGCVTVRPQAVKGAGSEIKAYVPIELVGKSLDASTIKANGDSITAEIELVGTAKPIENLTTDDFKFERDVTVTHIKRVGDTRVELTMNVNGAKDASSAAAVLNDQKLEITDENEIAVSTAEAHFYPVFDSIEMSGDNMKFTIIAYVNNGTLSQDIKPEQIVLGGDFEKGSVKSVERQNETTAKIVFEVPSNGQKPEKFSFDGKITIKAGAMYSRWGEPTTKGFSYTRNYSRDNVGKGSSFDGVHFGGLTDSDAINIINKSFQSVYDVFKYYVPKGTNINSEVDEYFQVFYKNPDLLISKMSDREYTNDMSKVGELQLGASIKLQNTMMIQAGGTFFSALPLSASVFTFCNELGMTDDSKEMTDTLNETEKIKEMVEDEYHRLCSLKEAQLKTIVTECDVRLGDLRQYINICKQYFNEKSRENLGVEKPEELFIDDKTTQFAYDLSKALADACRYNKAGYESCQRDFDMLQKKFELVCNQLLLDDGADPLTALDQAYANIDNFSTTSYIKKKAYRLSLLDTLNEARALMRLYKMAGYNFKTNSDGTLYAQLDENGKEVYVADSDTIDMTDEDMYGAVKERLMTGEYTYDDGTMEQLDEDMGINKEEVIKSTSEYKRLYKTVNNKQLICDFLYSKNNSDVINAVYNYKIEKVDLSQYTNPLFAEMKGCIQLANIKVSDKDFGTYVDESNPRGNRRYLKLWTYSQEPDSSIIQSDERAKPYCYPLNTTVSCVDNCYDNDDTFRAYTNYKDYQIEEFFNRLNDSGRTLLEELTNAGIPINKDYADTSKERGKGGDNYDPDNLYGVALEHSTDSEYDAEKIEKSWNTYTNIHYWDAKSKDDVSPNRIMVWQGLSDEAKNKTAIFIP